MYGMLLYMNIYFKIHKMKGITHALIEVATRHMGLTLKTGAVTLVTGVVMLVTRPYMRKNGGEVPEQCAVRASFI